MKATLEQGVPQGGVLSPTLFLIFVNDLATCLPEGVHSAMYADDLAIWEMEKSMPTATNRLQVTLNNLEVWIKKWNMRIYASNTTYTMFSQNNQDHKIKLKSQWA
uniref:Reverse transcriptase domain-containing protein n=1 Tax=Arion vulgaris TaxID=1028688 RepID=A0A0B7BNI2_9EUPU